MVFFVEIEGTCLLLSSGIYREAQLYACDGKVYARWSNGFIRLSRHAVTGRKGVSWRSITEEYGFDDLGRMITSL